MPLNASLLAQRRKANALGSNCNSMSEGMCTCMCALMHAHMHVHTHTHNTNNKPPTVRNCDEYFLPVVMWLTWKLEDSLALHTLGIVYVHFRSTH